MELPGARGVRERIRGLEAKAVERSLKRGAGQGGRHGERGKESLLQGSSRGQERIIFQTVALGGILTMKVKRNHSCVIRFGTKPGG